MIWEVFKEKSQALRARIDLFIKSKIPYSLINYLFIAKVAGSEIRQRIGRDIFNKITPQVNNAKLTKIKLTPYKKMSFKDAVAIQNQSLFRILSHQIAPDSTYNSSNSTS